MIVGFPAGSQNDSMARKFADILGEELGQRVLVVNREGGGGAIAVTEAARSDPDGYTVLYAPTGAFTSVMFQQDVSYEISDFRSIVPISETPFVIAVPADSSYETLDDLAAEQHRVAFSAFGEGHTSHLIGEAIADHYNLDAELVSFAGGPAALPAIINGDVDFGIQDIATSLPRLESGEMRVLAISTEKIPVALEEVVPDVQTLADYDLEAALFGGSQGLVVPADTPDGIIDVLREASESVITDDGFLEFSDHSGSLVPEVSGEEWFTQFVPHEHDRTKAFFQELGL